MSSIGVVPAIGESGNLTNSILNAGQPVLGNTGVANPNNTVKQGTVAGLVPGASSFGGTQPSVGNNNGGLISGSVPVTSGSTVTNPTISSPSAVGSTVNTSAQGSLASQLGDIYGTGVGGLIGSEISNLGSENSAYIQAYENELAPSEAQTEATLTTELGNEGIGANSSTAAIAQSNLAAQNQSQINMAAQQLTQSDIQDLLGLTTGTVAPAAEQEQSSNWWSDIIPPAISGGSQIASASILSGAL